MRVMLVAALSLLSSAALAQGPLFPASPHLLWQPCRVLDTRLPGCGVSVESPGAVGCPKGAMRDGEVRFLQFQAGATGCGQGTPPLGAQGVMLSVVAVGATGPGNLLLFNPYPGDPEVLEVPLASTLTFVPAQNASTFAVTALGQFQFQQPWILFRPDAAIKARVAGEGAQADRRVHVVVDLIGFYMPHGQ